MSKPVVVNIPHQLGRAEARRRIDEGVGRLVAQIGTVGEMKQAWEGDVLRFSLQAVGQTISGHIAIFDEEVRLEVMLPGFLAMLANKVKGRLRQEGQILLEHKR